MAEKESKNNKTIIDLSGNKFINKKPKFDIDGILIKLLDSRK